MYDSPLINVNGNQVPTLDILLMLTVISLLPSLLIMVTSFARTVIILSFLRNAIGVQQTPPNMVIVGIAIFLTLFIMDPVIKEINTQAYTPYKNAQGIHADEYGEEFSEYVCGDVRERGSGGGHGASDDGDHSFFYNKRT